MLTTTHILHLHLLKSEISLDPSPRDGEGMYENLANSGISTHYTPEMLDRYQKLSYFDGVSLWVWASLLEMSSKITEKTHLEQKSCRELLQDIQERTSTTNPGRSC